jgi:hypothetical protein
MLRQLRSKENFSLFLFVRELRVFINALYACRVLCRIKVFEAFTHGVQLQSLRPHWHRREFFNNIEALKE